ncbi:NAPDH dehydrogenase [Scheffersomyces coipomensis]|uniref:NAPDH dehydrogenase n=1 Tax=Scheffersomyces coipomensis TaxID=1788519 RepID=UPI00315CE1CA
MTVPKSLKDTKLFQPIKVGKNELNHRVVFAPTTRYRALDDHTPSDLELQYYGDRSQYPGSLITTEATFSAEQGGLFSNVPGIYTEKHVEGWKKINEKIHANKSFSSIQLWYLGRVGNPKLLKEAGLPFIAPSPVYVTDESKKLAEEVGNPLRSLTEEEIQDIIHVQYPKAAINALAAGFDYIEIHSAHGYLLDQFLQPSTNQRSDKYGGSIENRARIVLEIIDVLLPIVGADRLAIRLSPWAKFQNMKAEEDVVHPITTFSYVINELQKRADVGNQLAYISLVEPRVQASYDVEKENQVGDNAFASSIWKGNFIKAGNYTYDAPEFSTLLNDIEDNRTLVGFSRYYVSNPDLVRRLRDGLELTPYVRATFYTHDNWGYNTWNSYDENKEFIEAEEVKVVAKPIKGAYAI